MNKKEVEELLNKVFGVSVKWSKLSSDELTQILTVLNNPGDLIRRLGGVPKEEFKEEARKDLLKRFLESWEGPLISTLRDFWKASSKREWKESDASEKR